MPKIVNVDFKIAENLPFENPHKGFVEIRIENSVPQFKISEVSSPSKRVKEVLRKEGVEIKI